MKYPVYIMMYFLLGVLPLKHAAAQAPQATDSMPLTNLVISYDIKVESGQKKVGIADAYDGGSKTIFISGKKARVRLVSLMRMESIYFLPAVDSSYNIYRVKESMKKPEKKSVTQAEWNALNSRYAQSNCILKEDSMNILVYKCYKAIVHLADGREMEVYYTKELPPITPLFEPAFACVPGAVLKYSYAHKSGSISYTAVSVKRTKVSPTVFNLAAKPLDKISL
jgi:GLPGLI family protein